MSAHLIAEPPDDHAPDTTDRRHPRDAADRESGLVDAATWSRCPPR